jgi:hypothetical protein
LINTALAGMRSSETLSRGAGLRGFRSHQRMVDNDRSRVASGRRFA